ncbi:MAG: response regulator transcription factor [Pseudomonadota bacterium]
MRILIIEDDKETATFIEDALREQGWASVWCASPKEGLLKLGSGDFDCVILDRMLPDMDGLSALRLFRGAGVDTPVLMLTALGGLEDRVVGLDAGADDYLPKPFATSELLARLRSIGRRGPMQREEAVIEIDTLRIDRVAHTAVRDGKVLELSPLEFRLLVCLAQHRGEVVTRTMLLEKVWGYTFDPKTSLVQTHMSRLRTKLDKPFGTELIRTVRGTGYSIGAT